MRRSIGFFSVMAALSMFVLGTGVALAAGVQPAFSQEDAVRVLAGTVVAEESGGPLANVLVELESQGLQALTDSMGRFRIAGARAGIDTVRASYFNLAYSRTEVDLTSPGGHQVELTLSEAAFKVAPLVVKIEARLGAYGRLAKRIEAGKSNLIVGDEVRRRAPVLLIDFFRSTRGTRLRYVNGSYLVLFRELFSRRYCQPGLYLNARRAPGWMLETLPTDNVLAVEVYRDPNVPWEFKRFNRCGAINVWTGRS